jgi:hypothetical protein
MTNQKRPDFPTFIDSTMRMSFGSCPQKFHNEYFLNRRGGGRSVHLVAGKAFASGIEVARKSFHDEGNSPTKALLDGHRQMLKDYTEPEAFEDHNKNLTRMIGALTEYFTHYGWDRDPIQPVKKSDGTGMIELGFALAIPGTSHPQTGEPIIYCGRYDMMGQHVETGDIYAVDEKTTGSLGATWNQQWRHRAQLTGYVWAGRQYGIDVKGALIRGISILKTKYGHAESLQLRPQHYIDRWLEQLRSDLKTMERMWESGYWDFNFGDSCNSYSSPCQYSDACMSRDPKQYVKDNMDHLRWNPLIHHVEELDDDDNVIRIVE